MLRAAIGWLALLCWASTAQAQDRPHWVGSWMTAQLVPAGDQVLPDDQLRDATLRQVVRLSLGGKRLRVRLSNAFGTRPLEIGAASIARARGGGTAAIDPGSLHALTFNGRSRAVIPTGADYWSDPVPLPTASGADLAISLYLPEAPAPVTGHPGSRATSFFMPGQHVGASDLPGAKTAPRWLVIGGVDVDAPAGSAVVVLGDSITDGYGVQPDTNSRWTDFLAQRMRRDPAIGSMAVLNAGIGGNRLRLDGLGPNALARFDRDVLSVPGVSHLIVVEGVNDLGTLTRDAPATPAAHAALVEEMTGVLDQIVTRARGRGIKVIGGTIMPYGGSAYYHPDAANEADRQAINAWIRAPGHFDGVIDFDAALRDPARPTYLRRDLDNDGLHPSIPGYRAMADAVPLSVLSSKSRDRGRVPPQPQPAEDAIAFTFDDLPSHATLPPGITRLDVASRIIAALKAEGVPATGFINGVKIEQEPGSEAVLDAWRAAGLPLGNHGWRHANLNDLTDAQFAEELAKNEPILKARMGKGDWHWFRYPFLSEGSGERRAAIRRLLAAQGYKVATVTMDFSDWAYNDTYARCMAKGDQAAVARMETAWLDAAVAEAERSRAMARTLYGRGMPHVLLMHLGAFDARMLPRLIARYRALGFRFVSLEAAGRDPYYAPEVNPALPPQPQGLTGALAARGLPVPAGPALLPLETMCR